MKPRNHTAEAARLIDAMEQDLAQRPAVRVVQADNTASPVRWVALAFFVLGIPTVIGTLSLWDWTNMPRGAAGLLLAVLLSFVGLVVLIIGNGDFVAWREVFHIYRNEGQRIEHLAKMHVEQMKLENNIAKWDHIERMAEIESNAAFSEVFARLRVLEDRQHVGKWAMSLEGPASPSFTPATTDGARQLAAKYVLGTLEEPGLYAGGGLPHPRKVQADGRIVHRVPWSKRGEWKDREAVDALDVLQHPAPGADPLVLEERTTEGKVTGYYLNLDKYPSKADAIRVLGLV